MAEKWWDMAALVDQLMVTFQKEADNQAQDGVHVDFRRGTCPADLRLAVEDLLKQGGR